MSRINSTLTQQRLKELLHYDPETGIFTRGHLAKSRRPVGSLRKRDGYVGICVDFTIFTAHRLAWFYVHGKWPGFDIDHINGIRSDNRIANLRDAPTITNCENRRVPQKNGKSGWLGVSERGGRFTARITVNDKTRHLGCFGTGEEAHEAYLSAKRILHSGCTI